MTGFVDSPWHDNTTMASARSPRWAFFDKFEVPAFDEPHINYLTRWRLIQTPLFGVYLHKFNRPDSRPTFHDHPWRFLSIVLRGGYVEARPDGMRHVRFLNLMRAGDAHYVESLDRDPTWTLVLTGRRLRKWGYIEPFGNGYQWTAFDKHDHAGEFDAAMAARKAMA